MTFRDSPRYRLRRYGFACVAAFVVLGLITHFVARAYEVPSASMEPTLHGCAGCENDRILVNKFAYLAGEPQTGDIIVFAAPQSWNKGFHAKRSDNLVTRGVQNTLAWAGLLPTTENIMVKRVVATGGQVVSCQPGDASVQVNGQASLALPEFLRGVASASDAADPSACGGAFFGPVRVPEGHLWVMGDNRTDSADSRAHLGDELQGTVPVDNVRGKVSAVFFPLGRMGAVE